MSRRNRDRPRHRSPAQKSNHLQRYSKMPDNSAGTGGYGYGYDGGKRQGQEGQASSLGIMSRNRHSHQAQQEHRVLGGRVEKVSRRGQNEYERVYSQGQQGQYGGGKTGRTTEVHPLARELARPLSNITATTSTYLPTLKTTHQSHLTRVTEISTQSSLRKSNTKSTLKSLIKLPSTLRDVAKELVHFYELAEEEFKRSLGRLNEIDEEIGRICRGGITVVGKKHGGESDDEDEDEDGFLGREGSEEVVERDNDELERGWEDIIEQVRELGEKAVRDMEGIEKKLMEKETQEKTMALGSLFG